MAFPEMGDSVAEGTVLEWRVQPGDTVAVDDLLVEISTDKVDAEVPAPVAGTVAEILVEPDQTVQVGTCSAASRPGRGAPAGPVQPAAEPASEPAADLRSRAGRGTAANATPWRPAWPSAHGLDPSTPRGHRPARARDQGGRARRDGGQRRARRGRAGAGRGGATEPIRGPAATLVRFMNESRSIPTATSFRTLPVDALDARRKELKAAGKQALLHAPDRLGDRAGRARDWPVMGHAYAEEDGKPQRVVPGGRQPRPGRGRGAKGRQPLARRPGAPRRRRDGLRRLRRALRRAGGRRARQHARGRTPTRAPTSRSPTRAGWARWPRCPA